MENKAKESAEELVESFYQTIIDLVDVNNAFYYSKQCALKCVDKLIIQNGEIYLNGYPKDYYIAKNGFLFEVKEHLNAMKQWM